MDDPDPSIIGLGLGLCLIILAFTSAVDAAFTAISRHRLNTLLSEDAKRTRFLSRLIDDPYHFKVTILLLNASVTIAATAFTLRLAQPLAPWMQIGSLALLLLAILIVSEALPKALAIRNPDATALALSGPLHTISRLLWPLVSLISLITLPLSRLMSGKDISKTPLVTEEELRLLVNVGEEEGLIEHDEREMIEGIFSFGDTLVREIMVPRVDIIALDAEDSLEKALDTVIACGHSRIPVYSETIDNIAGILYAKDLLATFRNGTRDILIRDMMRKPHFVPETMKVDALLADLQQRKVHIAIIVDEYGGTAGLATIEDLIEQIVGEIQDEYDKEEPSIQAVTDYEITVDARVPIDDINDYADLSLTSSESDRIGGLVYEKLGRVPKVDDEVEVDQAIITVLSVKGLRAHKLRIVYQPLLELEEVEAIESEKAEEETSGST